MSNDHHPFIHSAVDILEHPWILVRIQAQVMTAHASKFRSGIVAVAFPPKDVVLNASDVFDVYPRLEEILCCCLRLMKNGEGSLLVCIGLSQHERPTDLCVIAINLR